MPFPAWRPDTITLILSNAVGFRRPTSGGRHLFNVFGPPTFQPEAARNLNEELWQEFWRRPLSTTHREALDGRRAGAQSVRRWASTRFNVCWVTSALGSKSQVGQSINVSWSTVSGRRVCFFVIDIYIYIHINISLNVVQCQVARVPQLGRTLSIGPKRFPQEIMT